MSHEYGQTIPILMTLFPAQLLAEHYLQRDRAKLVEVDASFPDGV
jgi:hypothetical protein